MKIKKLKLFDDPFIKPYLLIGGTGILLLVGGQVGETIMEKKEEQRKAAIEYTIEDDKIFEEGEHIIAIPIEDPSQEIKEYEGHVGYEPIGISTTGYGKACYHYGTGYILYENTEEVIAHPTDKDEKGNCIYEEFGYPTNPEKEPTTETLYPASSRALLIALTCPTPPSAKITSGKTENASSKNFNAYFKKSSWNVPLYGRYRI